mgnify:CR=1 FL=1
MLAPPAGQIAVMHRILVDEKKWVEESRYLHALNFCMLLPGPEATQLATYCGWLLHGVRGGLAAGVLFVLPSMFILMALTWIYLVFGKVLLVAGILSSSWLSYFLQRHMNRILGPVLILTGMILVELLSWNATGTGMSEGIRRRAEKGGVPAAVLLGAVFALSFCPVSAALIAAGNVCMGRIVVVVDEDTDPSNVNDVLWAIATTISAQSEPSGRSKRAISRDEQSACRRPHAG